MTPSVPHPRAKSVPKRSAAEREHDPLPCSAMGQEEDGGTDGRGDYATATPNRASVDTRHPRLREQSAHGAAC